MTFYDELSKFHGFDFRKFFASLSDRDVERSLDREHLTWSDYLTLLSPRAESYLEQMAQKAHRLTVQNYGRTMLLYTPMYLANFCVNQCVYCGFNAKNKLDRKKLTLEEVDAEAGIIAATGIKHILILTGESRAHSPVSYIKDCVEVLKRRFNSISIEIYPLTVEEYAELARAGVDGLTIYQEVYNQDTYARLHLAGPKMDYRFRLEAPDRGCQAGLRAVNVGALLGLDDWRSEAFFTGLHTYYLQQTYPDVEVSISPPRIRPHLGGFQPRFVVEDRNLVQYLLAYRLFMPRSGITLSTRERAEFRDHLVKLGVTKMSAGTCTAVGGRCNKDSAPQFEISDGRSVSEIKVMLYNQGYQPVFKDWQMW